MAIYHFSVKVISRANGSSALAAAAYRSASRLRDDRLDRTHDFTRKAGVVHSEMLLPENAPDDWHNREQLWNDVEAAEIRKDAQLAREIEFAIPRELNQADGIALARDFVAAEFVDRGMVADLNVHWDIGADGATRPHAHVMVAMRAIVGREGEEPGFGAKVRDWNRTELVEHWRERWACHVNERLAERDIDARIDHRSLADQGIALEPQSKIGAAAQRRIEQGLDADRADEHLAIARANGAKIIADPCVALDAITHQQATFTGRDLAMFIHRHSDGRDQFDAALGAVRNAPDLVELGRDGAGMERFTSRAMIEVEQRLTEASRSLAARELHKVSDRDRDRALAHAEARGLVLSGEQYDALAHVTDGRNLGVVIGHAGTGKSAMLGVAREAWEQAGYRVHGAALSGIAAENLEAGSSIPSRTIASLEHGWAQGRDLLTARDVLVVDEAGMIGTRQMERLLGAAQEAGAKVVLVGDPHQLQAIEAGAAFRAIHEQHGGVEITDVRRQRKDWQRDATRHLANGQTREALDAYHDHGMVHAAATREAAREDLIDRWDQQRRADPEASRLILTHTNDEVRELNLAARIRLRGAGELGEDVRIDTPRGTRDFAAGDRVMFLQNDRGMEVKNGTLATIEHVTTSRITVRLDDGRSLGFDTKDYARIDHGYAATIHKAQGVTVDRTHVLATPGMDRHSSYVALSRHRDGVEVHYAKDDFASAERLSQTLSRDRAKDMANDYARLDPVRAFAKRRGIGLRERVVEVVQKLVPEKVRGLFDGLRLNRAHRPESEAPPEAPREVPQPARDLAEEREAAMRRARTEALKRHARAIDAIFKAEAALGHAGPEQRRELDDSRKAFEKLRPHGPRDAEAAYAKDPSLAAEAGAGRIARTVRALQLETEIRTNPELRADRFVERWNRLDVASEEQYRAGDVRAYRATRMRMGDMARSLERDPQLESLLAARKRVLGIGGIDGEGGGHSIGEQLARSRSIDFTLGRGLGL